MDISQQSRLCVYGENLNLIVIPASYQQKFSVRCNHKIARMFNCKLISYFFESTISGSMEKMAIPSAFKRLEA